MKTRSKLGDLLSVNSLADATLSFLITLGKNSRLRYGLILAPCVVCTCADLVTEYLVAQHKLVGVRPVGALRVLGIKGDAVKITVLLGKHRQNSFLAHYSAVLARTFLYRLTRSVLGRIGRDAPLVGNRVSERIYYVSLLFKATVARPKLVSTLGTGSRYGLNVNHVMYVVRIKRGQANISCGHYGSRGCSVMRPLVVIALKRRNCIDNREVCASRQVGNEYYASVLVNESCLVYVINVDLNQYVSLDLGIFKEIHRKLGRTAREHRSKQLIELRSDVVSEGRFKRNELSVSSVKIAQAYSDDCVGSIRKRLIDSAVQISADQIESICSCS